MVEPSGSVARVSSTGQPVADSVTGLSSRRQYSSVPAAALTSITTAWRISLGQQVPRLEMRRPDFGCCQRLRKMTIKIQAIENARTLIPTRKMIFSQDVHGFFTTSDTCSEVGLAGGGKVGTKAAISTPNGPNKRPRRKPSNTSRFFWVETQEPRMLKMIEPTRQAKIIAPTSSLPTAGYAHVAETFA